MNQGRIWCVVNPTVGLPLLLGSVCVTSLIVHTAVLTHTTWYGNLYQGKAKHDPSLSLNTSTAPAALASATQPAFTITVTPNAAAPGKTETAFTVTVAPNTALAANTATPAKKVVLAQAR